MNIGVEIKYNGETARVEFPCDYNVLYSALTELRMPDEERASTKLFIENIEVDELSGLRHKYIYPEQIQHLGQRVDSMTKAETNKFLAVAKLEGMSDIKDMINLTYNMHRYTLIQDMSSMEHVGRVHKLTRDIGMSVEESQKTDFEKIGKELLESGKGQLTQYGLVFANDDLEYHEVYDGRTLPDFNYSGRFATVEIEYNGAKSYVYLPETPMVIDMAVTRLGATDECECRTKCIYTGANGEEMKDIFDNVLKLEGVKALNKVVNEVDQLRGKVEVDKLSAIVNATESYDSDVIVKITDNLDKFVYIEGAVSYDDVADYLIDDDTDNDFHVSVELRDYIDGEQFGKDIMRQQNGMFTGSGVIMAHMSYNPDEVMSLLDEPEEEQGMTMEM